MRIDKRKELFLAALTKNLGNVSAACEAVKISRSSYFRWAHADENFKTAVSDIEASFIDLCECKLRERILNNEWIPLKYYLENRARDRWNNTDAATAPISGELKVTIVKEIVGPVKE